MKVAVSLSSKQTLIFAIGGGLIVLGVIFFSVITMANQARKNILERQTKENQAPTVAVKRQVRKVILKKQTKNGEETIEIDSTGLIIRRDKNGKIIKTARQGFAATAALFDSINSALDGKSGINVPSGYTIIVETNQGNTTIDSGNGSTGGGSSGGGAGGGSIVDDIDDYIDHALNPTPTPRATSTPTPTATPVISLDPTPTPDPSALPAYMTAPPFTCEDYYSKGGKPIKISNVYCGGDQ
jgi:hypothetical protein